MEETPKETKREFIDNLTTSPVILREMADFLEENGINDIIIVPHFIVHFDNHVKTITIQIPDHAD